MRLTHRRTRFVVLVAVVSALAFAGSAWAKVEVGKPPPSLATKKVVNAEEIVPDQLRGKVVLLQLLITSSKPCKEQVVHLTKLMKEFGPKGLVVIGLSGDSKKAVEAFVKETKAKHPIIYGVQDDRKTWGLMKGYPTTYLCDVDGKVVWMDNWADKAKLKIEAELKRVTDLPWLPAKYKPLTDKATAKLWKDAGKLVREALAAEDLDPLDKPRLEALLVFLQKAGWEELKAANALRDDEEWQEARDAYQHIMAQHEGLPPADEAKKALEALLADKKIGREIEAWDYFNEMFERAQAVELESKRKAIAFLKKVVGKYRKTKAGRRAADLVELLKD